MNIQQQRQKYIELENIENIEILHPSSSFIHFIQSDPIGAWAPSPPRWGPSGLPSAAPGCRDDSGAMTKWGPSAPGRNKGDEATPHV